MLQKQKNIIIALVVCSIAFIAVTALVLSGKTAVIDNSVYSFISGFIKPEITSLVIFITNLGDVPYILILAVLFLLFAKTRFRYGVPAIITLGSASSLNHFLKKVFERPRPDILRLVEEHSFSFPSGHSASNAAFYCIIILLFCHYNKDTKARLPVIVLSALAALFIGVSRIYLGVHYFSDVLGGFFFGSAIGCAGFIIYCFIEDISKERRLL